MLSNAPPPPEPLNPAQITEYLEYNAETMRARRDALIETLTETIRAHAAVTDPDIAGEIAENLRMAAALSRVIEDHRQHGKKPFLTGGRVLDAWYQAFSEPLRTVMGSVKALLDEYGRQQLAQARQDARDRHAEAQADAARLAALAMRPGDGDAARLLVRAAEAATVADQAAALTSARPADLTRSRGVFGAVLSVREHWSYRVADISQVPRDYLMIDADTVRAAMKARDASGRPMQTIPGIVWVCDTGVSIR